MSKNNFSIYDYYHLDSIDNKLLKNNISFEKKVRRWFAKEYSQTVTNTFNTPWTEIVSDYYDSQVDSAEYNDIYNIAVEQYLPEVGEALEKSNQAYADSLIAEQEAILKANKADEEEAVATLKEQQESKKKDINMQFDMPNPDEDL